VVRISSLVHGKRITVPTRRTAVLNRWTAVPRAELVQGCALSENGIVLWVQLPEPQPRAGGDVLGVDIGMNKLISDSDGAHYGRDCREILAKVRRRRPGSKGRRRAHRERENFINRTVNQLPWDTLSAIGVERLHDMKRGKSRRRGKSFRKAVAPWLYRRVLDRIGCKAEERDVPVVHNDPAYTSQDCPACGGRDPMNRRGEEFLCVACGAAGDADTVGAQNILARTRANLGSLESPGPTKGRRHRRLCFD
jgi:IS605 OrfB family transposase